MEDFWDGQYCGVVVKVFKRIVVNRDGNVISTRIVKLKCLSTKIPSFISIFNFIFEISPNMFTPLQCNKYLGFEHTSKFCRSNPRYSYFGVSNHHVYLYPTVKTTDLCCIFCYFPHLATDRRE